LRWVWGDIKIGRYLGELFEKGFFIESLNFDLGALLAEIMEML
jgi:hypothetical protein